LNDELRTRLVSQSAPLQLSTIQPYFGSLRRRPDPSFHLLPGGRRKEQRVSAIAYRGASAPTSGVFPSALLIGRMRAAGREVVVNAIPFSPNDRQT